METLEYYRVKIEKIYSIPLFHKQIFIAIVLCGCYLGLQILDLLTTYIGLQLGAIEGNPLGINVLMICMKMSSPCLYPFGYYIFFKEFRNKNSIFFALVLINCILVLSYLYVLANNLWIISCLSS